ncbi:hypothetical protein [Roseomonas sp. KE2513]|uniref:hypothetical protein n=1 Tax=Roseomonas sp. KE2513 TaxID=2479202 RepID=UPI0018DFB5F0|nr:hypothetical protein [Roseomonas sp. KE2513]
MRREPARGLDGVGVGQRVPDPGASVDVPARPPTSNMLCPCTVRPGRGAFVANRLRHPVVGGDALATVLPPALFWRSGRGVGLMLERMTPHPDGEGARRPPGPPFRHANRAPAERFGRDKSNPGQPAPFRRALGYYG